MPRCLSSRATTRMTTNAEKMRTDLLIIGGGGHAKVVIDVALCSGAWQIVGVLDDSQGAAGREVLGYPVHGGTESLRAFEGDQTAFVVAIGSNSARERLHRSATEWGLKAATLV